MTAKLPVARVQGPSRSDPDGVSDGGGRRGRGSTSPAWHDAPREQPPQWQVGVDTTPQWQVGVDTTPQWQVGVDTTPEWEVGVERRAVLVVEVIVAVAVIFGVAMAVTGRATGMVAARPDRVPVDLPTDRPLNSADVGSVHFAVAFRGYRMDEVDSLLDRLGRELDERDARIAELSGSRTGESEGGPSWPSSS